MKINYSRSLLFGVTLFGLAPSILFAAGETEAQLLKQAKITRSHAEHIALEKVPNGKIRSGEIENEHHALVWSFDIVTPGTRNITEVLVNAKTGKIVEVSTETAHDQAKEQAADKAAGQK
ncbi:MAG: PepSY domain-containing protein [Chthoniobacterales bacterium]|nr:PepSY domain-containing protein [Chthoniobacterales bacterium]